MKLTKEECMESLNDVCTYCIEREDYPVCDYRYRGTWCKKYDVLLKLINEHFDNPEITSISVYRILRYKIDELEKALDKACEYLEYSDHFDGTNYNEKLSDMTKEQWKEYLLNGKDE